MKKCFIIVFVMLSFSCHRYVFGTRTHSYLDAHCEETKITDMEKEVCVMKENYKALLQRVDDNKKDIASLKEQKKQLENELENTRQTFSCEIENLHDITVQQKLELNDTNHSWTTFNETTHKLINRVNVLDNHFLLPGRCGDHINKTGTYINHYVRLSLIHWGAFNICNFKCKVEFGQKQNMTYFAKLSWCV